MLENELKSADRGGRRHQAERRGEETVSGEAVRKQQGALSGNTMWGGWHKPTQEQGGARAAGAREPAVLDTRLGSPSSSGGHEEFWSLSLGQ